MAPEPLPKPTETNNGHEPRLIVVSNRLPVTISKDANGEYSFKVSTSLFHRDWQLTSDVFGRPGLGALRLQEDDVIHLDRVAWQGRESPLAPPFIHADV
jgi:trehalose-6-phosphate synthase